MSKLLTGRVYGYGEQKSFCIVRTRMQMLTPIALWNRGTILTLKQLPYVQSAAGSQVFLLQLFREPTIHVYYFDINYSFLEILHSVKLGTLNRPHASLRYSHYFVFLVVLFLNGF